MPSCHPAPALYPRAPGPLWSPSKHHRSPPDSSVGSREPGSPVPRIQGTIGSSLYPALASQDRPNPPGLRVKSKVQAVPASGVIWSEAKTSLDGQPATPRWRGCGSPPGMAALPDTACISRVSAWQARQAKGNCGRPPGGKRRLLRSSTGAPH